VTNVDRLKHFGRFQALPRSTHHFPRPVPDADAGREDKHEVECSPTGKELSGVMEGPHARVVSGAGLQREWRGHIAGGIAAAGGADALLGKGGRVLRCGRGSKASLSGRPGQVHLPKYRGVKYDWAVIWATILAEAPSAPSVPHWRGPDSAFPAVRRRPGPACQCPLGFGLRIAVSGAR
jgi:hypothetical protein